MRVCVFLKFACNVYVNTGFMTVRGTEARHIQINSHIYNATASISITAAGRKIFSWLVV